MFERMSVVLKIQNVTKEKNDLYTIYLTDGQQFQVSEDILVRYRLLKDTELTPEKIREMKQAASLDVGFQQAVTYISYQLRTEKEVRQYLSKREIAKAQHDGIIDRLKDLKLVDDCIFSESYLRTQIRLGDKGPLVLQQKLKEKGVSETLIQEVLPMYSFEDQLEIAQRVAKKSMKKNQRKSFKESIQKTRIHLMQKGFSNDIIQEAISTLAMEPDEEQEWAGLVKEAEKTIKKLQRFDEKTRRVKLKQRLFQKGFSYDFIQKYMDEEYQDETE